MLKDLVLMGVTPFFVAPSMPAGSHTGSSVAVMYGLLRVANVMG
jgi:hypothetical protein